MPEKPRVVYWNHSPTPYFVERFNAVADRGSLEFEAWFNERRQANRSWDVDEGKWRFRARYIPSRPRVARTANVPVPEMRSVRPDLVVQEYDRAHFTAGFLAAKALGFRTAFRVLPNYDAWSRRTWWREAGKHFVFAAVDAAKVPGPDGRNLATRYGLSQDRIYQVVQSIDVDHYAAGRRMSDSARERRRIEMGLCGCVFIYVGRLWSGKGVGDLLEAYRAVALAGLDVSLLIVGDGPEERRFRDLAVSLPRVRFAGFAQARELPGLYGLADVMVFPTHGDPNGLVVEEAMAAGLPVISSTEAGDIRARVPHGEAGIIVPPRDPRRLAAAMTALADAPATRRQMSEAAVRCASLRTHARYAAAFETFVLDVLGTPRRESVAAFASALFGQGVLALGCLGSGAPLLADSC